MSNPELEPEPKPKGTSFDFKARALDVLGTIILLGMFTGGLWLGWHLAGWIGLLLVIGASILLAGLLFMAVFLYAMSQDSK